MYDDGLHFTYTNYCSIDDCDSRELPLHWSEFKLININGTSEEIVCNDCIEELESTCNCHRLPSPPTVCTHSL